MQIPSGDSFGNRSAQLKSTNIQGQSSDGLALMKGAVDGFYNELKTSALLDANNELFDYQVGLDTASSQVAELLAAGKITDKEIAPTYQKLEDAIKPPNFDGLDRNSQKQYLLDQKKLSYNNKLGISLLIKNAGAARAGATVARTVEKVGELAYSGKVSASGAIQTLENNEDFQKTGEFGFGFDWSLQKEANYQRLQSSYISGGIKDANDTGSIDQLKTLRAMLLEDNPETNYLTSLIKSDYLKQINASIDVNVGRSYANTLVDGMNQQVEKTGNLSAVNAYSLLRKTQGDTAKEDTETAKYIANQMGVKFDQQQFNNNPQYTEQLKQTFFNQALDRYGSPAMAAISIQVGHEQMNSWLKEFGNPSKGQLSEADFINKMPDEKLKQTALKISQQKEDELDIDSTLALIDRNKNLNDDQKRIAKASIKSFMLEKQQALKEKYQENHQAIWNQLYVKGEPINKVDASQLCALTEEDRKQLLEKTPPTQLDFQTYQEARGRVMAGKPIDLVKDYFGKIPKDQLKELIDLQENIKNDPARRDGVIKTSTLINSRIKAAGFINEKNLNILNASIVDDVESFEKKNGRVASPKEILDITDKQFVWMRLDEGAWFDTQKPYYQMTKDERKVARVASVSNIPQKELRRIKDALKIQGLSDTEDNIIELYSRKVGND
ncbi:hypothetical protein DM558_02210 [Entomomonas moraniae]|uniref:Uncharacterized protein n=1 Tax=Entomomonas moraniae TaxID=2213226 RepID=A0A3S9XB98_9GAMM|nr:hypothetical protein [Entomomonas moraniae]AZS49665.1 hypothetical protein DM558_02210 [Entomomonas moraniae]